LATVLITEGDWYDLFNVKPGDKLYVAPEERPVIW
jgi:predicted metalloendopeptidase